LSFLSHLANKYNLLVNYCQVNYTLEIKEL